VTKRDAQRIGGAVADKLHTPRERDVAKLAERVPPQNPDAEAAVLGSMLLANECIGEVGQALGAEDFYSPENQVIYAAMLDLYEHNKPADVLTLLDALGEGADGSYLKDLLGAVPSAANAIHYAALVRECAMRRALISYGNRVMRDAWDATGADAATLLDTAGRGLYALADRRGSTVVNASDWMAALGAYVEELCEKKHTGVSTGIVPLDEILGGLRKGEMIVIAGRPSMGKSSMSLNIYAHAAMREAVSVAFFSCEMSKESLGLNLLSAESGVTGHKIRRGFMGTHDHAAFSLALGRIAEMDDRVFVDDSPNIGLFELRAKCRSLAMHHGLGLVILDYLQLMQGPGLYRERHLEVAEISKGIKGLARELNVPVIAVSQLNRMAEARSDNRPRLADLRESGAIEQDADVVILLHREEYYNPTDDNRNVAEAIVAKQRNGPTGMVKLQWEPQCFRFRALARGEA